MARKSSADMLCSSCISRADDESIYTGCPRRNVPDFRRMFLMLKYTDITQNTYIQSWTVMEIMAREKFGLLAVPCTVPVQLTRYLYTAHVRPWDSGMQSTLLVCYERLYWVAKMPFVFSHVEYCDMHFVYGFWMAMHVLLLKITKGVFPIEGLHLEVYLLVFTRHRVILVVFQVLVCSLKGRWYERLTHERTFLRWFRVVHVCPLVECLSHRRITYAGVANFTWGRFVSLPWSMGTTPGTRRPCSLQQHCAIVFLERQNTYATIQTSLLLLLSPSWCVPKTALQLVEDTLNNYCKAGAVF